MSSILKALSALQPEAAQVAAAKQIVELTRNADASAFLASMAHLAAANAKQLPGSITATELCKALSKLYGDFFGPLGFEPQDIAPNYFTAFRYGEDVAPKWRLMPALFLVWLLEEQEQGRFASGSVVERLLEISGLAKLARECIPVDPINPPAHRSNNYCFFYAGSDDQLYTAEELNVIRGRIRQRVGDRPEYPEYPMMNRRFPATPTYEIEVGGRKLLIKDESARGTGTHKERMAHEVIVEYARKHIPNALGEAGPRYRLPRYSMISSGSAAIALQIQLDRYRLPNLHVVIDKTRTPREIREQLTRWGAVLFPVNLEEQELTRDDVLRMTNNLHGEDLTTRGFDANNELKFYDWLSCEVLNLQPAHIFVPVGTGELFANFVHMIGKEENDRRRLHRDTGCVTLWGASTKESQSDMHMLYAKHRPALGQIGSKLEALKSKGLLGPHSAIVHELGDEHSKQAMRIMHEFLVGGARYDPKFSLRTDPSGIAGLALYLKCANEIPADDRVVIINTGCVDLDP